MAYRSNRASGEKSLAPRFSDKSKMRRYEILYDDTIEKMRAGFMRYASYSENLDTDIYWEVEPGFEHRIDLISKKFYNTSKYDWALEQINDIKDPIKDLSQGKKILIPSKTNILSIV
jgi:hypothetical protein